MTDNDDPYGTFDPYASPPGQADNEGTDQGPSHQEIIIDFDDPLSPRPVKKVSEAVRIELGKQRNEPILLVIRHGNTFQKDEVPRRIGARTDLPLTRDGAMQITQLRHHLEIEGILPQRVYSSPLQRTLQTAQLLGPSYEILEFLREIYHGMDENKTDEEIIRRIGRGALERWERDNLLAPGWTADILGIRQGWMGLKKLCRDAGNVWGAVTSGGIARFALENVERAPAIRKLDTGAYGILVFNDTRGVWVCEGWNIKPENATLPVGTS